MRNLYRLCLIFLDPNSVERSYLEELREITNAASLHQIWCDSNLSASNSNSCSRPARPAGQIVLAALYQSMKLSPTIHQVISVEYNWSSAHRIFSPRRIASNQSVTMFFGSGSIWQTKYQMLFPELSRNLRLQVFAARGATDLSGLLHHIRQFPHRRPNARDINWQ